MLFSSLPFLYYFLPAVLLLYFIAPKALKNTVLLLSSLIFYAWGEPKYVFLMIATIFFGYLLGILTEKARTKRLSRFFLALAVIIDLGALGFFKYANFFIDNFSKATGIEASALNIALPIGISFYTFQILSYNIDVYRGTVAAQKNPIDLGAYITMFPQLIAGPIVRYSDIRTELTGRSHNAEMFSEGAGRFIIGLSKKAILANTLGAVATNIMGEDLQTMGVGVAWIGAIFYMLQIYFDFSGYSDMAIGLGKIFGFHFSENFNYPYISKSIREFWRRWHISLSSWFRDYLYIPLGGSRRGNVYLHLLIVFLATGIWHGAAWGFVLWGLWHGFFIIAERVVSNHKNNGSKTGGAVVFAGSNKNGNQHKETKSGIQGPACIKKILGWIYTMLVVVVGWVLFALVSVRKTAQYLMVMFGMQKNAFVAYSPSYYLDKKTICIFVIALFACVPWKQVWRKWAGNDKAENEKIENEKTGNEKIENEKIGNDKLYKGNRAFAKTPVGMIGQKIVLLLLLGLCFVFIITGSYNPFIYFRF